MGFFRFRRSIKLFPGVRWNIGAKSSSLSFGGRGAHYTIGPHGTRSTFGIPGTGLSYTEFHSAHKRVAERHPRIPEPSAQWLRENRIAMTLHTPNRKPSEPPMRPDQLEEIRAAHVVTDESQLKDLGEDQATDLLGQIHHQQKEVSKTLLKRFYAAHGHAIPDDFIDHAYDHPGEPYRGGPRKSHGCLLFFAFLALIGWLSSLSKKEDSAPQPPSPPHASLALPSGIPSAPSQVSGSKSPGSSAPASNSQLPAPKYWPKEVRISSPVVLSGSVDGGTIRQTAKPGAVIDATLSDDHHTVTLRRLGITGTLPIEQTDFLDRAHKAQSETP